MLTQKKIPEVHLYTLRKGEIARNVQDRLVPLEHEIVKIKGRGDTSWACLFYDADGQACTIYPDRPAECRALKCWDSKDIGVVMARPYLQRRDLLGNEEALREVIEVHETRCAYDELKASIRALQGPESPQAATRILDMLRYDHVVRSLVPERLGLNRNTTDFFFGRSLSVTIRAFGLEVRQEGSDFTLQPLGPPQE